MKEVIHLIGFEVSFKEICLVTFALILGWIGLLCFLVSGLMFIEALISNSKPELTKIKIEQHGSNTTL